MTRLWSDQLADIKARQAAATPGPWGWFGNTSVQDVYLATKHHGRHFVMKFERWGMRSAQPEFFAGREVTVDEVGRKEIRGGHSVKASAAPIFEVAHDALSAADERVYRQDIVGIRNADATFIANSRADIDYLVGEVDRLEKILDEGIHVEHPDMSQVRQVGWRCEHPYNTPAYGQHMSWSHKKNKMVTESNVGGSTDAFSVPNERRCPDAVPLFVAVAKPTPVEVSA